MSTPAARQTGIPAGSPLMAGATDKACEVIGAFNSSVGCLSYGISATILRKDQGDSRITGLMFI